jgi:hypothetical protein
LQEEPSFVANPTTMTKSAEQTSETGSTMINSPEIVPVMEVNQSGIPDANASVAGVTYKHDNIPHIAAVFNLSNDRDVDKVKTYQVAVVNFDENNNGTESSSTKDTSSNDSDGVAADNDGHIAYEPNFTPDELRQHEQFEQKLSDNADRIINMISDLEAKKSLPTTSSQEPNETSTPEDMTTQNSRVLAEQSTKEATPSTSCIPPNPLPQQPVSNIF